MAQQTAIDWLIGQLKNGVKYNPLENEGYSNAEEKLFEQAKQMEKQQIINSIMYALDEDGHTGDWKIKFANDYYNKLNEGYDFSNKTRPRNFGEEAK